MNAQTSAFVPDQDSNLQGIEKVKVFQTKYKIGTDAQNSAIVPK